MAQKRTHNDNNIINNNNKSVSSASVSERVQLTSALRIASAAPPMSLMAVSGSALRARSSSEPRSSRDMLDVRISTICDVRPASPARSVHSKTPKEKCSEEKWLAGNLTWTRTRELS